MRIIMVRHGQTAWNKAGKLQGHSDVPLDELGRQQIQATADYLAKEKLEAVYTSDLSRARDTAVAIASYHGLEPISDRRLRELNMGIWEGLDFNTVYTKYRREYDAWYGNENGVVPGGEGVKDVEKRVLEFIRDITPKYEHGVAVATHGGVIKAVLAHVLGKEYLWNQSVDHASVNIFEVDGDKIISRAINIVPWKNS